MYIRINVYDICKHVYVHIVYDMTSVYYTIGGMYYICIRQKCIAHDIIYSIHIVKYSEHIHL